MEHDLLQRIHRTVRRSGTGLPPQEAPDAGFDALVREAYAFQVERIAPVRALAEARGIDVRHPEHVQSWRDVPPVPALAFKGMDLFPDGADADRALTFRSSGTTAGGGRRSLHRHPFPDLYRATIDAAFPARCLPRTRADTPAGAGDEPGTTLANPEAAQPVPMLSLIPSRTDLPDSSLSFMVDHAIHRWGSPSSAYALGPDGLDAEAAAAWVRDRERTAPETPCLVLATAFALATWLDRLDEAGTRLTLPSGSVLFETGGFKGRTRALSRDELTARVDEHLGIPAGRIVREYGMTELTSQLYTHTLDGGDPTLFRPPPWVRVRVLDPQTLEEAAPGTVGLIAIFDLANLGSTLHLLTEDLGVMEQDGLRLVGRARGAELRGCSLVAEELGVRS